MYAFNKEGADKLRGTIQKLKSQTGASITFALLLFLVCTVISSVVIVAATTAAGRMSQLPEMDQRYYAVTSAARLLQHEIDGKTVKVAASYSVCDYSDNAIAYEDNTLLGDASINVAKIVADPNMEAIPDKSLTLGVETDIDNNPALNCSITETLGKDCLLRFTIQSGETKQGVYALQIVFSPNIRNEWDSEANSMNTILAWRLHSLKKLR